MPSPLPDLWHGLVDDAAIFPPGDVPLHEATAAHTARRAREHADLVGTFVLRDTDLPLVRGSTARLSVVVTGGAGQLAGPLALARRLGLTVAGVELALRDPGDLSGNARRVVAALDEALDAGAVDEDTPVHVELPSEDPTHAWLAAADVVAERGLRLKFRTGGQEPPAFPTSARLAGWIEAALDRETPFKCTAGLHHAVAHTETDLEHHGFVNVLLATRAALDGGDPVAALAERDEAVVATAARELGPGVRTWFTSFGSCDVRQPLDDLLRMGLL